MNANQIGMSPMHDAIGAIGERIGIPDDLMAVVKCVDCGKEGIGAHFHWTFNMETKTHTGPHCGCAQAACKGTV